MMQFLCSDTLKMKEFYPQPLSHQMHPKMQALVKNNPNSEVLCGSILKLGGDNCLCELGISYYCFLEGPDIPDIDI
jgi:hypothetical protein